MYTIHKKAIKKNKFRSDDSVLDGEDVLLNYSYSGMYLFQIKVKKKFRKAVLSPIIGLF